MRTSSTSPRRASSTTTRAPRPVVRPPCRPSTRWLARDATTLTGPNAHAYVDVNSDNVAEEVAPSSTPPAEPIWDYLPDGAPPYAGRKLPGGLPSTAPGTTTVAGSWGPNREPERNPALLLRQHVPRLSRRQPDRVQRGCGELRGSRPPPRGGRRWSRRPRGSLPARVPPEQREHVHAPGRILAPHADVSLLASALPRRERRRRRVGRLPRVHARSFQPTRHRCEAASRRCTPRKRARWARAGATGMRWTISSGVGWPRTRPPTAK